MTPRQLRDRSMKGQGWTHRDTTLRSHPYLKLYDDTVMQGHGKGATFTSEEQKFYFLLWDRVVEL